MAADSSKVQELLQQDKQELALSNSVILGTDNVEQSLNQLVVTKKNLKKARESLTNIVDSIAENPSMLSKLAEQWGGLSRVEQLAGGIVISAAPIVIGVLTSVGSLLTMGGVLAFSYSTTGFFLDDHHQCNLQIITNLKAGILNLADVLEVMIKALDKIQHDLAKEVEKFKVENKRLLQNIDSLNEQVIQLKKQTQSLVMIQEHINNSQVNLEATNQQLDKSIEEQRQSLEKNNLVLAQLTVDSKINNERLAAKIEELQQVKKQMRQEVEKAQQINSTLQTTVKQLTDAADSSNMQQQKSNQEIEAFFGEKKNDVQQVFKKISKTNEDLEAFTDTFSQSNKRYLDLLNRQESQIDLLEKYATRAQPSAVKKINKGLLANGFIVTVNKSSRIMTEEKTSGDEHAARILAV